MSWQLSSRPQTLKVTKAMAKEFADMEACPGDRPLSERRLAVYEKIMRAGGFRPVTWAKAYCKETDGTYRVNGKHTSTLLAALDRIPEFYCTIESYSCDTLEDVSRLYATFDSTMQSRSAREIYLSFASTVTEYKDLTAKVITSVPPGVSYHIHGESYGRVQAAERAETLLEYPEFVLWLSKLLSGGMTAHESGNSSSKKSHLKSNHLYRQPVVAAMFACWSKAKAAATEFWMAVRDETGSRPELPDRKLARWLVTSTLSQREHSRIRPATIRETYCKSLHAWNAWRKGESTNLNYHPEAKLPAAV